MYDPPGIDKPKTIFFVTGIDIFQLRNKTGIIYREALFSSRYSNCDARRRNMRQQQKKQYSGKMSPGAKKRLARVITLMCQALKPKWVKNINDQYVYHKLSFITLTISCPDNLTHRQAYDLCFSHFLQWLRRTKKVTTYIWKAELQKRGQIHYHITTPSYIDWKEIRHEWNRLQRDAGLLTDYFKKHHHYDPNSTDIHEVRSIKKLDAYLVKELAKSIQNVEATDGKIWDCSDNLDGKRYFSLVMTKDHFRTIEQLIREKKCEIESFDFFDIVRFEEYDPPDLLSGIDRKNFNEYLESIMNPVEETAIAEECVQMEIVEDLTQPLTWSQMQIILN